MSSAIQFRPPSFPNLLAGDVTFDKRLLKVTSELDSDWRFTWLGRRPCLDDFG